MLMLVRVVRNGFSLQVSLKQRPECREEMSHSNNWRISLAGNEKCKCPEVRE